MQVNQYLYDTNADIPTDPDTQLVLAFANRKIVEQTDFYPRLAEAYPNSQILGCTTAGEILGTGVYDEVAVINAIRFESTQIQLVSTKIQDHKSSIDAGQHLASILPKEDLRHIFVLSEGLKVNGSELVQGLTSSLPAGVAVTGGLSGDESNFNKTLVMCNGPGIEGQIAILGLYGNRIKVGFGSLGGWDTFGPVRLVTRSQGNVLYELDGKPALQLYKKYLGEHAEGLPATGLLFPLTVRSNKGEDAIVRTILAVDESEESLTFAGDIKQGDYAQLMKANFDRLVDGAESAARIASQALGSPADFAILVSCVGRKMVLQQQIEEETEAVAEVLGDIPMSGFYSYGEISPFNLDANCELHNQTMTITTISEG